MSEIAQVTKDQHFVPQFYLRSFLNKDNKVEVLNCERKLIGKSKPTTAICYKEFFYGMKTGKIDNVSQYIENAFQKIENKISIEISSVIDKILENKQIVDSEKWLIATLMSMLWIRGPIMRRQVNSMSEKMIKNINTFRFGSKYADSIFDKFDQENGTSTSKEERNKIRQSIVNGEYTIEVSNYQHLMMFDAIENFANLFFGQYWTIYISRCSKKFITSDNPVAVEFPKSQGFYGPTFLERTHYLSLTPDICIVSTFSLTDCGKKIKRKTLFMSGEKKILELNFRMANHAYEYAYATDRQSLEDILEIVKKEQELLRTPFGRMIKEKIDKGEIGM